MKIIQVSDELWNEIAKLIAADILKQAARPLDSAEELGSGHLPSYTPRHFTRGPRLAESQQNIRIINDKLEVAYPEDGIMQAWDLPSKSDRDAIREVRDKALEFAERHGASNGQLKAIMKALTENGYYLIGPRRPKIRLRPI